MPITIDEGGPSARVTRRLLEAWLEQDESALEAAINDAEPRLAEVLLYLVTIVGGTVQAIAMQAERRVDDVLASLWTQLAATDGVGAEGRLMREVVAAWLSGDDELAALVNEHLAEQQPDPWALLMHFLAAAARLARGFAEQGGFPIGLVVQGWWQRLGPAD